MHKFETRVKLCWRHGGHGSDVVLTFHQRFSAVFSLEALQINLILSFQSAAECHVLEAKDELEPKIAVKGI